MNAPIFIDTSYILALINTADEHHNRARAASQILQPPFITTEAVLTVNKIHTPLLAQHHAIGWC